MATYDLANLDNWTKKSEARMEAVFQESVQTMTFAMLTPVAKGGNLPVRTGFLINSFNAALNSIPSGDTRAPAGYNRQALDATALSLVINRATIGDRIAVGSAANYAEAMEAKYGYLRLAAQNWPSHVKSATNKVKREVTR